MADMAASPGGNEVAHGGTLELCFFLQWLFIVSASRTTISTEMTYAELHWTPV